MKGKTTLQGQEERIIFISTVLSKPETLPAMGAAKGGEPQLGFWRNPRRFNVAITRAKCLLVVLGHPLVLIEVSHGQDRWLNFLVSKAILEKVGKSCSLCTPSFLAGVTACCPRP